MAKRIPVSFKNNDRDSKLYLEIYKQGDKSNFIKDAVEFYLKSSAKKEDKNKVSSNEINNILGL